MKALAAVQEFIRCPLCRNKVELHEASLQCVGSDCQQVFPIVNGVPILINERRCILSMDDILQQRNTFFQRRSKAKEIVKHFLPDISRNITSRQNFKKFAGLLLERSERPQVLVIGGSRIGKGMNELFSHPAIELVETDIALGPRTMLICDAHEIPFEDESFDGVIAQAVLHHIADPYRCVEEIHRVLKKEGLVYAESAFMQQVCGGPYDFTRFTHLGHRRLFRKFDEIDSGVACGPGMALAWSYQYFLLSFTTARILRAVLRIFARLTSFYLTYFDYYLAKKVSALDAASGYYFMGRKSGRAITDQDLIHLYKGAG